MRGVEGGGQQAELGRVPEGKAGQGRAGKGTAGCIVVGKGRTAWSELWAWGRGGKMR